jgi:hypothetical protein
VPRAAHRFSRRQVRECTKWGDTQLKIHLARLVELEYLLIHRGGRGQSFEYELLYDGAAQGASAHASGLIDVEALRQQYDAERSGSAGVQSGAGRGVVGGVSAPRRMSESAPSLEEYRPLPPSSANGAGNAYPRPRESAASYVPASL